MPHLEKKHKTMKSLKALKVKSGELIHLLQQKKDIFCPIINIQSGQGITLMDFTSANSALAQLNLRETGSFNDYITGFLKQKNAQIGTGGYLEKRIIYRRSEVFEGDENRCIHLGIDIWAPAFTPIFAPLEGTIHSFKDNNAFGDYGPTIILQHTLGGITFYTLYGHLTQQSLAGLQKGMLVKKGEAFTEIGPFPENGDWPPHLHFQIIMDMEGREGDFPGVAAPSEIGKYSTLCPNPQLILNLKVLEAL